MKEILREVIAPQSPVRIEPVRLSVLDCFNPQCFVSSAFSFAPQQRDGSMAVADDAAISAVRNGIRALLAKCPLLAGRIRPCPSPPHGFEVAIPCDGSAVGVLFTVIDSEGDADARSDAFGDGSFVNPAFRVNYFIDPLNALDHNEPIFAVRLTRLSDSGFCVGVSIHHWISDAEGYTRLSLSLAAECRRAVDANAPNAPPIKMDRCELDDGIPLNPERVDGCGLNLFTPGYMPFEGVQFEGAEAFCLTFTPSELAAMKEACGGSNAGQRSTLSVRNALIAHVWRLYSMAEAETFETPPAPETVGMLAMAADSRTRLNPPLSREFIGNTNVMVPVWVKAADLLRPGDVGLSAVANAIRAQIDAHTDGYIRSVAGWLKFEMEKGNLDRLREEWRPVNFGNIYVTDWSRCALYDADFGFGGKPVSVLPSKMAAPGCIFCARSPTVDGGILVYLQVTARQAAALHGKLSSAIHAYLPK